MNTHLQAYNGQGQAQSNNPDVVVKSSSDVKVSGLLVGTHTHPMNNYDNGKGPTVHVATL